MVSYSETRVITKARTVKVQMSLSKRRRRISCQRGYSFPAIFRNIITRLLVDSLLLAAFWGARTLLWTESKTRDREKKGERSGKFKIDWKKCNLRVCTDKQSNAVKNNSVIVYNIQYDGFGKEQPVYFQQKKTYTSLKILHFKVLLLKTTLLKI